MTNVRRIVLYASDQNNTAFNRIRSAMDKRSTPFMCRYAVTTVYTPKVRRIWNYKGRHGNATASKTCVVATLFHCLVRECSHRRAIFVAASICHTNVTRTCTS